MKILDGEFYYGKTVTLEIDGKIIKRKVHYGSLDGEYILYDYEKIGKRAFQKNAESTQD